MNFELLDFCKATYLQWIALIFAISLLIWGTVRIRAYFLEESDTTDDNHRLLNQFRDLQTQGELTDEEYRKLKSRMNLLNENHDERDTPCE